MKLTEADEIPDLCILEVTERTITKSMLASKNIRPSFTDPDEGERWIRLLAVRLSLVAGFTTQRSLQGKSELALRLVDAREVTPAIWPKTIAVHFVQGKSRNLDSHSDSKKRLDSRL